MLEAGQVKKAHTGSRPRKWHSSAAVKAAEASSPTADTRGSEEYKRDMVRVLRGGGLIAPALHDTAERSIDDVMASLRDIVGRVRVGRIRSSEMSDATVTVSILGEDTADTVLPVIYPPQVAIIGCGAVRERPWIIDGAVVPRRVMTVAVAASCAFLTPIGHKNNTLIMGPGGYRFGDYWRMGLPLELLIIAVSVPALVTFWPL